MTSRLAPGFLIAMPQLVDGYFTHSVIFLLHHDDSGAMGIVVNRELELPLSEVARQQGVEDGKARGVAYYGGPVEMFRGFVLYRGFIDQDDTEISDNVFVSGSVDVLQTLLRSEDREFRLFLGYAGWGPGQLDHELAIGSWLAADFDPTYVFDLEAGLVWKQALDDMGIDPATVLVGDGEIQ